MAEVKEQFPNYRSRTAGTSAYDKYLDGQVWFIPEDEITIPLNVFRTAFYQRAEILGRKVRTSKQDDGLYVEAYNL